MVRRGRRAQPAARDGRGHALLRRTLEQADDPDRGRRRRVAKITIDAWCSNDAYTKIVANNGATYDSWHAFPYCWNDVVHNFGWDNPYWRLHARNAATLGGSDIWGRGSLQRLGATIRAYAGGWVTTSTTSDTVTGS